MKLLIAVGGGGHFSPALAVIKQLPSDWKVLIVGRKHAFEGDSALSLEYQTAQQLGIPFKTITAGRLQRKFSKRTAGSLMKVPVGGMQAFRIVKEYKPDVVLSFGGYVTVPVAFSAKALRTPVVVHEQILQAGLANKLVSKIADKVCISWEESAKYFPRKKIVFTGNPIREEFIAALQKAAYQQASRPTLYITGGSGGAHGINALVEGCLEQLLESYYVIHQTGDAKEFGDFQRLSQKVQELPEELRKRYVVKKFISPDNVVHLMQAADLVVSRAGINTVTELLYLGKPCLLIPLPYGQKGDQKENALFVERVGIGKYADQHSLNPSDFLETIQEMLFNIADYKEKAKKAHALIHTDAAQKIISVVQDVAQKKS